MMHNMLVWRRRRGEKEEEEEHYRGKWRQEEDKRGHGVFKCIYYI